MLIGVLCFYLFVVSTSIYTVYWVQVIGCILLYICSISNLIVIFKLTTKKVNKSYPELMQILLSSSSWNNNGDNELAKENLQKFLVKLKKVKPCKYYEVKRSSHLGYIRDLLKAKIALDNKLYQRACHELSDLLHNHCYNGEKNGFQRREYYNIIQLLEENL